MRFFFLFCSIFGSNIFQKLIRYTAHSWLHNAHFSQLFEKGASWHGPMVKICDADGSTGLHLETVDLSRKRSPQFTRVWFLSFTEVPKLA